MRTQTCKQKIKEGRDLELQKNYLFNEILKKL